MVENWSKRNAGTLLALGCEPITRDHVDFGDSSLPLSPTPLSSQLIPRDPKVIPRLIPGDPDGYPKPIAGDPNGNPKNTTGAAGKLARQRREGVNDSKIHNLNVHKT